MRTFKTDGFTALRKKSMYFGATAGFLALLLGTGGLQLQANDYTEGEPVYETYTESVVPYAQEQVRIWSFADDEAWQGLAPGRQIGVEEFDTISPALALSGVPNVTVVPHSSREDAVGIQMTGRGENWHTLDILFDETGVQMGGSYRFVASGQLGGTGNRTIFWNQNGAPWNQIAGTSRTVTGTNTQWNLDVTLTRQQIVNLFVAQHTGLRIQTGGNLFADLTIEDIAIYQVGEIDESYIPAPPEWDLELQSLQELFKPFFSLGNIYNTSNLMDAFDTRQAYLHHFNAITAENWHKPDHIAGPGSRRTVPTREEFDFAQADAVVNFAVENDLKLVGHAFVWHSQSPDWMFRDELGQPLTRQVAIERMEHYIRTLSEHFAEQGTLGAFYSWDVANEVIASGGGTWTGNWQTQMRTNSPWFQAFGNGLDVEAGEHASDFVFYAFYFARKYFPYSILYYNDYNEEIPAKRNAIANMVEDINERWTNHPSYDGRLLIEAIGMQSHYHMQGWSTNFNNVPLAIDRFLETGARVSITELDITYGGSGSAAHPSLSAAQLQRQANAYARVFGYYLERAADLGRVSIWGMADPQSWRANGFPLLFDGSFSAKPAFQAIVDTVTNFETPEIAPIHIITESLELGLPGERFSAQLQTDSHHAPVWFEIKEGQLPPGLVLHSRTGVIEGVPTAIGDFPVTFAARSYGGTTFQSLNVQVDGVVDVTPTARVNQLQGNQNELIVTVAETWVNGEVVETQESFMIRNNASGTFTVGGYEVFVNTQGNTQIREIFVVE